MATVSRAEGLINTKCFTAKLQNGEGSSNRFLVHRNTMTVFYSITKLYCVITELRQLFGPQTKTLLGTHRRSFWAQVHGNFLF